MGGLACPGVASAQLISPGKLSKAHAELEGIRHCTQCHELRRAGASEAKCLACHTPLAERIESGRGFHASLAERNCATCHKEHFGVDFALVRLDTLTFDHALTGFELQGRHTEAGCRGCHTPEHIADEEVRAAKQEHNALRKTFLGLPDACASCHDGISPHGTQFAGRACTACHDTGGWEGAGGFDHDRADFHLTGRHREVTCSKCHETTPRGSGEPPAVRYEGVKAGQCTDCHDDEHDGAMKGRCESCHATSGWQRVDRRRVESTFDHRTTGFVLEGTHASAACASCHQAKIGAQEGIHMRYVKGTERRAVPRPDVEAGTCLACHDDRHQGVFIDRDDAGDCTSCHGQDTWLPARFDARRHDHETSFPLEGAHRVVACMSCHVEEAEVPTFRLQGSTCLDCHADTSPHGDQFAGRACDGCHGIESFRIETFAHEATRFPLGGAHAGVSCASCHRAEKKASGADVVVYRPLGTECRDCHGGTS
jgi:hypothetical protein